MRKDVGHAYKMVRLGTIDRFAGNGPVKRLLSTSLCAQTHRIEQPIWAVGTNVLIPSKVLQKTNLFSLNNGHNNRSRKLIKDTSYMRRRWQKRAQMKSKSLQTGGSQVLNSVNQSAGLSKFSALDDAYTCTSERAPLISVGIKPVNELLFRCLHCSKTPL